MKKNIKLLYGFSFFDQFMIVIAVFALVILSGEVPSGLLSDLWEEDTVAGLPPVLSALGILFSIAFVFLLLPLVLRQAALSPDDRLRARK